MADNKKKCPECPPPGLPGWMATFSDMVTLLLTFFVLLLSFAKTETAKYEAALGSLRDAFGGNALQHGEVSELGKSPDDSPTILDSKEVVKPFPIDFMTTEGFLDKLEINRESEEVLENFRQDLKDYSLSDSVDVFEIKEGIKVNIKDKIFFKPGKTEISEISIEVFDRLVKMVKDEGYVIYVIGHAAPGEKGRRGADAYEISSRRALEVSKALVRRGVHPTKVTPVFYGDTRPEKILGKSQSELNRLSRRVEFIVRKRDLQSDGRKTSAY